ncbi:MAG: hypothetical protein QE493_06345 [Verrucomicrobiae bacterium]|nr:hypothetical protein [Verrucomicrobiae bacterium]
MDTASASNCSSGSIRHTADIQPSSQSFAYFALISFTRPLMTLQYEISGLTPFFFLPYPL